MPPHVLLAFALAVLPLSLTPGASSSLVLTRVLTGGPAQGVKVAVGTVCGLYVHATTAALGLAAVVMASSRAFLAVKLVGAAYLVALGVAALLPGRRGAPPRRVLTGHGSYVQAFLGNVLNPKAAGVYLTLLPQFVDPARPVAPQIYALATVHAAVALAYLCLLSHVVSALGRPAWRTWVRRVSGAVLLVLGLRSASAARA